ncbi:MAG: hypothetical protein M1819_003733 [Sarea resinae]|nr:MAG: hypothetical protein M1819_003733 [Sarea resinae]
MAQKRKNASTSSTNDSPHKRAHLSSENENRSPFSSVTPRTDPSSGQRSAFPGLDDGDASEPFYGPANDGIDYLKMVRSEAKGVPSLLVAPKQPGIEEQQSIYESGVGDARGYYFDGAYTAAPAVLSTVQTRAGQRDEGGNDGPTDPQDAYYTSLLARFDLHTSHLHLPPPAAAIAALDDSHPITLPQNSHVAFTQWRQLLQSTDPAPAQLASMDQDTVLRLLQMTTGMVKRRKEIEPRLSTWVWALLGRLREVGCLGSEEVAVVRELGKKAVDVRRTFIGWRPEAEEDTEEAEEEEEEEEEGKEKNEEEAESKFGVIRDRSTNAEKEADGIDQDTHAAPLSQTENEEVYPPPAPYSEINTTATATPTPAENSPPNLSLADPSLDLAAAKARLLAQVTDPGPSSSPSPSSPSHPPHLSASSATALPIKRTKTRTPTQEKATSVPMVDANTLATLDMIVTVVGDCYGQRDLLEFRDLWDEEDNHEDMGGNGDVDVDVDRDGEEGVEEGEVEGGEE